MRTYTEKGNPDNSATAKPSGLGVGKIPFDLDKSIQEMEQEEYGNANFDEAEINVELEQGKSQSAGKLQYALLKQSAPSIHCQYFGQAARHINMID